MNKRDIENKTQTAIILPPSNLISCDGSQKKTIIKVGGPPEVAHLLWRDNYQVITIIFDSEDYFKINELLDKQAAKK